MTSEHKLIVAGGRDFEDYALLTEKIFKYVNTELNNQTLAIVSGMARGADSLAVRFAREQRVRLYEYPADWNLGRGAGFIRNKAMGDFADGLLAFWSGSNGTRNMIEYMLKLNKPVRIVRY